MDLVDHSDFVRRDLDANTTFDVSDSSGQPIAFGTTETGRFIAVVFEVLNLTEPLVIRPIKGPRGPRTDGVKP